MAQLAQQNTVPRAVLQFVTNFCVLPFIQFSFKVTKNITKLFCKHNKEWQWKWDLCNRLKNCKWYTSATRTVCKANVVFLIEMVLKERKKEVIRNNCEKYNFRESRWRMTVAFRVFFPPARTSRILTKNGKGSRFAVLAKVSLVSN